MELERLVAQIEADVSGLRGELANARTQIDAFTRGAGAQVSQLASTFKGVEVAAKAMFLAFAGNAIGNVIQDVVKANVTFQSLSASLKTVEGSVDGASRAWKEIERFATSTPYQVEDVTKAFIRLKSMGLDASMETLESYGNTASSMSKSLMQMIEAVADATTGEFERLKEFGIRASQEGDKVTFTFRGISTTVGKSAAEIGAYLKKLGDTQFAGAMAEQMKTLGGAFSNLQDAVAATYRAIGQSGFNDSMIALAQTITKVVQESDGLARALGQTLATAVDAISAAIKFCADNAAVLALAFVGLMLAIAPLVGTFTAISAVITAAITAYITLKAMIEGAGAAQRLYEEAQRSATAAVNAGTAAGDKNALALQKEALAANQAAVATKELALARAEAHLSKIEDTGTRRPDGTVDLLPGMATVAAAAQAQIAKLKGEIAALELQALDASVAVGLIGKPKGDDGLQALANKLPEIAKSFGLVAQGTTYVSEADAKFSDSLRVIIQLLSASDEDLQKVGLSVEKLKNLILELNEKASEPFDKIRDSAGLAALELDVFKKKGEDGVKWLRAYKAATDAIAEAGKGDKRYRGDPIEGETPEQTKLRVDGIRAKRDELAKLKYQEDKNREAVEKGISASKAATDVGKEVVALLAKERAERELSGLKLYEEQLRLEKTSEGRRKYNEAQIASMVASRALTEAQKHQQTVEDELFKTEQARGQARVDMTEAMKQETEDNGKLSAALLESKEAYEAVRREIEITKRARELQGLGASASDAREAATAWVDASEAVRLATEKASEFAREAERSWEPFKAAITNIQGAIADGFYNVLNGEALGSIKSFAKNFLDIMLKTISQIAAAMVFKPIIGEILGGLGAPASVFKQFGFSNAEATAGGAGNNGNSFDITKIFGGGNSPGGSLFQSVLDTPLWGTAHGTAVLPVGVSAATGSVDAITSAGSVGAFTSEAAMTGSGFATGSAAAAAPFTVGNALPGVGAALSIYNAVENPNVGTIGGAALTTAGAAMSMFPAAFGALAALGPYGMIAGAILSILGNTVFKKKPSNEGSQTSYDIDQFAAGLEVDFTRTWGGNTKWPGSASRTDALSEAAQGTIRSLAEQFPDVKFQGGFGGLYGKKEGTNLIYDPEGGTLADRKTFKFDPSNQEETAKAYADLALAALKDADWSGLGETVATAVGNSAAEDLQAFLADVDFAKGFQETVDMLNSGADPVTSQLAQIKTAAEAAAGATEKTIQDFLDRTNALWPEVTRTFNEAGEEIQASTKDTTSVLSAAWVQSNTEAESVANTLMDASSNVYTFTGAIGDATLELTDAAGNISTAFLDAATNTYSLTRAVEDLSGAAGEGATTVTELSQQQKDASLASKNFILATLNLNDTFRFVEENGITVLKAGLYETVAPLTGLDLALETSRASIEAYRDVLINAGVSIADAALIIETSISNAAAVIHHEFSQLATMMANQSAAILTGQSYIPGSATEMIGGIAGDNPLFKQWGQGMAPEFFKEIDLMLGRARSGSLTEADLASLRDNFANQAGVAGRWTPAQLNGIAEGIKAAYQAQRQNFPDVRDLPTNTGGGGFDSGGGSDGGGGGGGRDDGANDAIRESIDSLRDFAETIRDTERDARQLGNAWLRISRSLRDAWMANETNPDVSPEPLMDIYNTAAKDFFDAVELAASGSGEEAQEAADRLPELQQRFLELSKILYGTTDKYVQDFTRSQNALKDIELKAFDISKAQLAIADAQLAQLVSIEAQLETLNNSLSNGSGGGSPPPGGGGSTGGGSAPPSTPPSTRDWGSEANVAANKQLAAVTGYTGDFGGGKFDAWIKVQPAHVKAAAADVMFGRNTPERITWYNWGSPENGPDNVQLARVTGYRGDFGGGGFDAWIKLQPESVKEDARNVLRASGHFERITFHDGGLAHDEINATLKKGEYVIPSSIVNQMGTGFFDSVRSGKVPATGADDMKQAFMDASRREVVYLSDMREMKEAMARRDADIKMLAISVDTMVRQKSAYGGRG